MAPTTKSRIPKRTHLGENMDDLIGEHGEPISADSIRARLSAENQAAIDAKMSSWFESELHAFDLEAVREIHKWAR